MKQFDTLITHLNILKSVNYPTDPFDFDEKRMKSVQFQFEMLPYTLSAMWHAIVKLVQAQNDAIEKRSVSGTDTTVFIFPPEDRCLMSYYVDSFLEASRRCQNSLIPYISQTLSVSLPQSMHDVIKGLKANKYSLPDTIRQSILNYWSTFGRKLKNYRDLSQHFAVVSSDARLYFSQGKPLIHLVLPNNPEQTKVTEIAYVDPEVHALPYILDNFFALLEFVYIVTLDLVVRKPAGQYMSIGLGIKAPILMGANAPVRACQVPRHQDLELQLDSTLQKLEELKRSLPNHGVQSDAGQAGAADA